jgi:hypothetical protein
LDLNGSSLSFVLKKYKKYFGHRCANNQIKLKKTAPGFLDLQVVFGSSWLLSVSFTSLFFQLINVR